MQVPECLADLVNNSGSFLLGKQGTTIRVVLYLMEKLPALQALGHEEESLRVLESFVKFEYVGMV